MYYGVNKIIQLLKMGKKRFNWKARQVVETKIIETSNSKVRKKDNLKRKS